MRYFANNGVDCGKIEYTKHPYAILNDLCWMVYFLRIQWIMEISKTNKITFRDQEGFR